MICTSTTGREMTCGLGIYLWRDWWRCTNCDRRIAKADPADVMPRRRK